MTYIAVRQCHPVCILVPCGQYASLLIKFWIKCDQFISCCSPDCLYAVAILQHITREKRQSYVILIKFEWNGLKESEINNLKSS